MKRYKDTKPELLSLIAKVGTHLEAPYFDHPDYDRLMKVASDTNEIVGICFHETDIHDHPFVAIPKFVPGFKDTFVDDHIAILGTKVLGQKVGTFQFLHRYNWTNEHLEKLYAIKPYDNALEKAFLLALDVINDQHTLALVSGPISTGGGTKEENLTAFSNAVANAANSGYRVFNQMSFQPLFSAVHEIKKHEIRGYFGQVFLDRFYFPLMETGKFSTLLQLPNWESSVGAKKEYVKASALKMKAVPFYNQKIIPNDMKRRVYENN